LDDQLCFALYAATNAVVRAYRPLLADIGLTYPQYLIMLVLWQDGPSVVTHIADRLNLAPNAISPLLDRLEKQGLLTRQRDRADRRIVHVELTQEGREAHEAASMAQYDVVCRTHLAPDDLNRLREELRALADRIGAGVLVADRRD
jgi:DNA-binding MarR family transcriptional regulator